jgi:hypothetical protein
MPVVLHQAEAKNVPIIRSGDNVTTIVANIERALSRARFSQEKLAELAEIMAKHLDFQTLDKGLGLTD